MPAVALDRAVHAPAMVIDPRRPLPRRWHPTPLVVATIVLHAAALAALLVHPESWPWLLLALVANHAVLTATGLWPRSRALGPNWTRLPPAAVARGAVAITIDDGPDPDVTPRVLALLAREQVRATFFVVGEQAARHPELCRAIVSGGHAIENHSLRHPLGFALLGVAGMEREMREGQRAIEQASGATPLFFRPPAGLRSPMLEPALCRVGLQLATWTRRGFDTRERDAARVLSRLLTGLGAGDILLVHDGSAARTADGTPIILAVLPELIAAIRTTGLLPIALRDAL